MHFEDDGAGRLTLHDSGGDGAYALAQYVYSPDEPQLESPRPYALLSTRAGSVVTAYRPDDHVWHKGLSLALPVVGDHNFWGGPTYVHGEGYVQLPNNGAQRHRSFVHESHGGIARVTESLEWISEAGETVMIERRTLTARAVDADTWALTWRSALRNTSGAQLAFGSPTSKGRGNAGYAGIFWRGPQEWTGGDIVSPIGAAGDAARGEPGPWLAFVAPDRSVGVLVLDVPPRNSPQPRPWFARSEEYAGLNPAPFFYDETVVAADQALVLAAAVVVGTSGVAACASTVGAELVAELDSDDSEPEPTPDTTPHPHRQERTP